LRGAKFTQGPHLSQHPASSFSKKVQKTLPLPGAITGHAAPLLRHPQTEPSSNLIVFGAIQPGFGDLHALLLQHNEPTQQLSKRRRLQIKL